MVFAMGTILVTRWRYSAIVATGLDFTTWHQDEASADNFAAKSPICLGVRLTRGESRPNPGYGEILLTWLSGSQAGLVGIEDTSTVLPSFFPGFLRTQMHSYNTRPDGPFGKHKRWRVCEHTVLKKPAAAERIQTSSQRASVLGDTFTHTTGQWRWTLICNLGLA